MKTSRIAEARVEESIVALFHDLPALCGFTVRAQGRIELTDVGLYPPPPLEDAKLICEEIHDALAALVEERPEAQALIAGRTFARSLH
jgi:hypothetical protein